jgi:outer membrane protein assembly factor BamB
MIQVKTIVYMLITIGFVSSCELFGGGGEDNGIGGGEVVWSIENQTDRLVGTQPLIENGKVYFLQDGYLKAYGLEDGNYIWKTQVAWRSAGDYSRTIVESDDRLFLDQGYNIKAFNMSNGSLIWDTRITDDGEEVSCIGSPVMSQYEAHLYAGRDGYVVQLRKADGQITRRYPLDRLVPEGITQGSTEPIISPFGDDILYVPTSFWDDRVAGEEEPKGNLFAFDSESGEMLWGRRMEFKMPRIFGDNPNPEDTVIVSSFLFDIEVIESYVVLLVGRFVSVVDRFSGEERWSRFFPDDGFDVGLAVEGTGIYIASAGWHATRLDLETGAIVWRRDIRFSNTSIPTVTDGRMYFNNSGGGGIWVLDAEDGSVIFQENTPNYRNDSFDVYISSLGVGEGYMVNVGSKAVYCLTVP